MPSAAASGGRSRKSLSPATPPAAATRDARGGPHAVPSPEEVSAQAAAVVLAVAFGEGLLCPMRGEGPSEQEVEVLRALPGPAERRHAFRIAAGSLGPVYEAVRNALGQPSERLLWHGTSWQCLPNILRGGFNRAYSGRHGCRFGVGTYFSSDPEYALRFCGKPSPRALLLAKVLVGRSAKGSPELLEPPLLEGGGGRRYDSAVDNCDRPRIFCVFRDFQALPVALVVLE